VRLLQGFEVPEIDTVFELEEPFSAQWLRLVIHDALLSPSGRACWHLTLIGCPVEHGKTTYLHVFTYMCILIFI